MFHLTEGDFERDFELLNVLLRLLTAFSFAPFSPPILSSLWVNLMSRGFRGLPEKLEFTSESNSKTLPPISSFESADSKPDKLLFLLVFPFPPARVDLWDISPGREGGMRLSPPPAEDCGIELPTGGKIFPSALPVEGGTRRFSEGGWRLRDDLLPEVAGPFGGDCDGDRVGFSDGDVRDGRLRDNLLCGEDGLCGGHCDGDGGWIRIVERWNPRGSGIKEYNIS